MMIHNFFFFTYSSVCSSQIIKSLSLQDFIAKKKKEKKVKQNKKKRKEEEKNSKKNIKVD